MRVSTKLSQGRGTLLQPYGNALTPSSKRVDVNQCHRHRTGLARLDLPSRRLSYLVYWASENLLRGQRGRRGRSPAGIKQNKSININGTQLMPAETLAHMAFLCRATVGCLAELVGDGNSCHVVSMRKGLAYVQWATAWVGTQRSQCTLAPRKPLNC